MRISAIDKLNALSRSKVYLDDYHQYTLADGKTSDTIVRQTSSPEDAGMLNYSISLSEAGKTLCKKWDLFFPFNPEARPLEEYLFCAGQPIQFVPSPSQWTSSQARCLVGSSEDKVFTHINDKLALLIDLSFPKERLRTEFDSFLDCWTKNKMKGSHKTSIDKWLVFDLSKSGKNLLQITREIHQIENHPDNLPAYNESVNTLYQQTKRAYQAACDILKTVEQASGR